ncbi:jg17205 [Pararge aegeria aegeria]|uniref:Jg17205 protein n=1 Tax=Pararge aegeria aegeria TaxID=348720 RepID=A0A8S4SEQ8_9NEOP|nr:jg17205 [Pararge aegeria aegeria]
MTSAPFADDMQMSLIYDHFLCGRPVPCVWQWVDMMMIILQPPRDADNSKLSYEGNTRHIPVIGYNVTSYRNS